MEVGAALMGGAGMLWKYNRSNYMYDREMRLKQEFKVMEYRNEMAELWRDDIREIIGLTERRMDSYLIVSALQLDMCIGLFCEGRIEGSPGMPPPTWLLNLYMLTLGGAFMYLLMAIWLAMHAMVVAQCTSVRLLTQFVRLPVPTWPQMEAVRTYAANFEQLGARNLLRVPFVGKSSEKRRLSRPSRASPASELGVERSPMEVAALPGLAHAASAPQVLQDRRRSDSYRSDSNRSASCRSASSSEIPGAASAPAVICDDEKLEHIDPWETERVRSDIYELMRHPPSMAHHISLARQAARYYQCYDAFARVAMSFGTNQLLSALAYFSMGYCTLMNKAASASWVIVLIVIAISIVLVSLDFSMTRGEKIVAQILIASGPLLASIATYGWVAYSIEHGGFVKLAFATHCAWLIFALRRVRAQKQPNGSVLPINFRPTRYLDIFGWLSRSGKRDAPSTRSSGYSAETASSFDSAPLAQEDLAAEGENPTALHDRAASDVAALQSEGVQEALEPHDKARVERLTQKFKSASGERRLQTGSSSSTGQKVRIKQYTDYGVEVPYFVDPVSGEGSHETVDAPARSAYRTITEAEDTVERLCAEQATLESKPASSEKGEKAGTWMHEEVEPLDWHSGATPGASGVKVNCQMFGDRKAQDEASDEAEESDEDEAPEGFYDFSATFPHAMNKDEVLKTPGQVEPGKIPWKLFRLATWLLSLLWLISLFLPLKFHASSQYSVELFAPPADIGNLGEGELLNLAWPTQNGFVPRALSCDMSGRNLVVADDFGLYAARIPGTLDAPWATKSAAMRAEYASWGLKMLRGSSTQAVLETNATFERVTICEALEGQTVQDIDVMCSEDGTSTCRVMVLHGLNLTECPLIVPRVRGIGDGRKRDAKSGHSLAPNADIAKTWTISGDWLQDRDEEIYTAAVTGDCNFGAISAPTAGSEESMDVGCIVVGTSRGRIVQLRRHLMKPQSLVPQKTLTQSLDAALQRGTLHVYQGRFIMLLRPKFHTLQALSAEHGGIAGEWRLPMDTHWLAICGGGDSLFLLGRKKGLKGVHIWRFHVPDDLSAAAPHGDAGRNAQALVHEF